MRRSSSSPVAFAITAALIGSGTAALHSQPAFSQAAEIEEVVVTARKREESIQKVPVAVTAVTGGMIEEGHVANLIDIGKLAPNVTFTVQGSAGMAMGVSIRGISYDDLEKSFEPTVGVSVDGVFLGSNSGMNVDLDDVESIEVLRGPQGTLFGRNTIGGVVNLRRAKPTGEWGLKAEYDRGSNDREDAKIAVNFPIVADKLAGKINVRSLEGGGFQYNVTRGEDVKGRDLKSGTLSLLFTPTDSFEAVLRVDSYEDDNEGPEITNMSESTDLLCSAFGLGAAGCRETSFDLAKANDFKTSYAVQPHFNSIEGENATLEMNWDVGSYVFTSITGYQNFDEYLDVSFDGAPVPITQFIRPQEYDQISQELRVATNSESSLDYVLGLYYLSSEYTTTQDFRFFGSQSQLFTSNQKLSAYAVFGEANYALTDSLKLTFGGRFTEEEKEFFHDHVIEATGPFTFNGTKTWSDFTHRLGLDYSFNDRAMAYVSWGTGFRSGGWNGRPATPGGVGPFDPEYVDNYEVGMRTSWLDNRLVFNATLFYMEYEDKQEFNVVANPTTGGFDTRVENAASASYQGVEIEGSVRPFDEHDVVVRFSLGLLDAKYDKWLRNGVDVSNQAKAIYAPEVTSGVGVSYDRAFIGSSEVNLSANWSYTDEHRGRSEVPVDTTGRDIVPSDSVVDVAANFKFPVRDSAQLFLSLYGRDVFGEDGGKISRPVEIRPLMFVMSGLKPAREFGVKVGVEF